MSPSALAAAPPTREAVAWVKAHRVLIVSLVLVLAAGAALRLVGGSWDGNKHLHPDERYVSTVADNIDWPRSLGEYLDVETSPLSPYTNEKGRDYIYGTLPLFGTKLIATATGQDAYGELSLVGRRLAAALDMLTAFLVFAIALSAFSELGRRRAVQAALVAAALYAFTVTSIQHTHFFTTDVWLVFFGTLTFLLAMRSLESGVTPASRSPAPIVLLVGLSLGLTIACKVSGVLVVVPVALALVGRALIVRQWSGTRPALLRSSVDVGLVLVTAYVAFRAVSPYTFARSNWLDLSVNSSFRTALENQARATAGESLIPPSYQWLLSTPGWSPLENLALWQLGLPFALAALVGLVLVAAGLCRAVLSELRAGERVPERPPIATLFTMLMLLAYVLLVFLYFGTRFVHSGRYLLPLVPLLAVAAAWGLAVSTRNRPRLWAVLAASVVGATALWALAFVRVYTEPNTRMAASEWIRANVDPGSSIANEHWDDPLPVGALWAETIEGAKSVGGYRGLLLPVFDPDEPAKLRTLFDMLSTADLYVVSSPRAWNTIGRLPDRFPLMVRFYDRMFAQALGFERAAEFTSYPEILGVEIRDRRAEEAFWVYDHPPVTIFRRAGPLDWETFVRELCPDPAPHCPGRRA